MIGNKKDNIILNKKGRVFCLGDLHGSYKGLKQVFEKSGFDFKKDKAIFLGDIIDGWSESKECIDFIMQIPNKVVIMGNHDEWAYYYFTNKAHYANNSNDTEYLSWKSHGGYSTINSLTVNGVIEQKYIDFLASLPYYHEEDDNLFVHAGLSLLTDDNNKILHPSKQHPYYLCWDRDFIRTIFEYRKKENFKIELEYKEIFVGHTSTTSFNNFYKTPQNWKNVWNMDTASAFDGCVSMMNVETKEVFQSDLCYKQYPNEKGRNQKSYNEIKRIS